MVVREALEVVEVVMGVEVEVVTGEGVGAIMEEHLQDTLAEGSRYKAPCVMGH